MRRMRQRSVCTFNRVLVLPRREESGVMTAPSVSRKGARGRERCLMPHSETTYTGDGTVWTHIQYPGTPARVTGQENEILTNCPVHVAGTAVDVLARVARSLPPFQWPHRNAGTACLIVP